MADHKQQQHEDIDSELGGGSCGETANAQEKKTFAAASPLETVQIMYDKTAQEYLDMMKADASNEEAMGPTRTAIIKLCQLTTGDGDDAENDDAPQPKGSFVDVGCGPGTNLVWLVSQEQQEAQLLHQYNSLVGIDLSPAMIELAKKESAESQDLGTGIDYRVGNMLDLGEHLVDSSVAAMCNLCSIQHVGLDGIRQTFSEAARVLQPGGYLLLQFWTGDDVPLPSPEEEKEGGGAVFMGLKPETVRMIVADINMLDRHQQLVVEEESRHVYPEFDMPYAFFYIRKK